jgi:two-component SAPR family response regulator
MKGCSMSLFSKVLEKLGMTRQQEQAPKKPTSKMSAVEAAEAYRERVNRIRKARAADDVTMIDVMAKLEKMAKEQPQESNWKTSIADLLFLLGIDHSKENRVELAKELGCPEELMEDSAKMNTWLHKAVLVEIAENGGNIPSELLD